MIAPASVPQVMIVPSFHHWVSSPPRLGMMSQEARYVRPMETKEVIHTSEVSGASKFISSALPYFALAIAPLMKYARALATSMIMRITKIQTSNCTCTVFAAAVALAITAVEAVCRSNPRAKSALEKSRAK